MTVWREPVTVSDSISRSGPDEDTFFGEGMSPDQVRVAAASLFVGP